MDVGHDGLGITRDAKNINRDAPYRHAPYRHALYHATPSRINGKGTSGGGYAGTREFTGRTYCWTVGRKIFRGWCRTRFVSQNAPARAMRGSTGTSKTPENSSGKRMMNACYMLSNR